MIRKTITLISTSILIAISAQAGDGRIEISQQDMPSFDITAPGSYVVTENLTVTTSGQDGIEIRSPNVTIDLNGFTIQGGPGTLNGIKTRSSTYENITIKNGVIRDWGDDGIDLDSRNARIIGIESIGNGGRGIRTSHEAVIDSCISANNTNEGFVAGNDAVVTRSVARSNGLNGFFVSNGSVVENCIARDHATGIGIETASGCVIKDSTSRVNEQGIKTSAGAIIENCVVSGSTLDGIAVSSNCVVRGSSVQTSGDDGINTGDACQVTDCRSDGNDENGISVAAGSSVRGCDASNNGTDGIDCGIRVRVEGCNAVRNGDDGIEADNYCSIISSQAISNNVGIVVGSDCRIERCTAIKNDHGFLFGTFNSVVGNTATFNGFDVIGGKGFWATGDRNHLEGNHASANDIGFYVSDTAVDNNTLIRNVATQNGGASVGNYSVNTSDNDVGPIGTAATSTSPWANISN